MTEAEWLSCTDLRAMGRHLETIEASKRKNLLVQCGCIPHVFGYCLEGDERGQRVVQRLISVVERYADGLTGEEEYEAAWDDVCDWNDGWCPARREIVLHLLREVFGNPFRPVRLDPRWLTWNDAAVRKLAQVIYDEKRFLDLPLLADALEDAGCDNEGILVHCRRPGEHVRGCWVVDLLLGKE